MKRLAIWLLLAVSLGWAQDGPQKKKKTRQLESIDWNPATCELTWVVSPGAEGEDGQFVRAGEPQNYSINMDKATMTFKLSTRRFSTQEAQQVHAILNALSTYAIQSTQWWEAGKGLKLDKQASAPLPTDIFSLAQHLDKIR